MFIPRPRMIFIWLLLSLFSLGVGLQAAHADTLATSYAFSGVPASTTAGTPFNVTVTAKVGAGTDTGYTGTVTLTSSDPQAVITPASHTYVAGDSGAFTFSVTLKTAPTQSLTASGNGFGGPISTGSSNITVNPTATSKFLVSAPSPQTAGTAFNVTVTPADAFDNPTSGYAGTVHFTSDDAAAVLPADGPFGAGTFSVTLKTVAGGPKHITVNDTTTTTITGTSNGITVDPGSAATLTLAAASPQTVGASFSVTVTAKDSSGNVATGYAGTVHFTSTDGQAVLPADATLTNGTRTFSVTLNTTPSQTLTVTDTGNALLTDTKTITVNPGAASSLALSAPANATAGAPFSVTVTAKDSGGNVATGYSGTVHFSVNTGAAVLPADATLTNGTRTFSVTLKTAPSQTLKVQDTANGTLTDSQTVAVTAAAATQLSVSAPPSATSGGAFSVTVTAKDQFGNTDTGYAGTVHITSTDGQAVLPADSTLTSGSGTFSVTLKTVGTQHVTATDTTNGAISGTSGNINVGAGGAATLTLTAPANATAGAPFSVTVTAKDSGGNVATGYSGTVHFSVNTGAAVLPADATLINGTRTFSVTLKTAPSQTLKVQDTANGTLTDSQTIAVTAAAATRLAVSATTPVTAGGTTTVTVTAQDQFGNTDTGYAGTVHITSTDPQAGLPGDSTLTNGVGTFSVTLKTTPSQTVTATDTAASSIRGTSNAVTVNPDVAASLTLTAPASATAGSAFSVTVTAKDQFGNVATGYSGTVQITSSDAAATFTPPSSTLTSGAGTFSVTLKTVGAGSQTVTATDTVNAALTDTKTVNLGAAAAASLSLTGVPVSTTAGVSFSITVTAFDSLGNVATGYTGPVHFTSSDGQAVLPANSTLTGGTGTFSATLKTVGSQSVTVTDVGNAALTASESATVTPAAAATLAVSAPSSATAGASFSVTVTAKDPYGNTDINYAGTVHFTSTDGQAILPNDSTLTSGSGSFAFTLKTTGSQTVSATDTVTPSISGTSGNIAVTANAAGSLSLTPSNTTATVGVPFSVTVTLRDQFGNLATGYAGTVHFSTSDTGTGVVLPADYTFTLADHGAHTFNNGVKLVTAGPQTVTATDSSNSTLTSVSNVTVGKDTTTISMTGASNNPSAFNDPVTFTANVTSGSGLALDGGSVQFKDGSTNLGAPQIVDNTGKATITTTSQTAPLAVGTHSVSATYLGDSNFQASSPSNAVPQTVTKGAASTSLSSDKATATFHDTVTFTAVVTGGGATPTGTVQFQDNFNGSITNLGSPITLDSSARAKLPVTTLTVGTHQITAIYQGDNNFLAGPASAPVTVTINPGAGSVTLTSDDNPSALGETVNFAATVTGTGGVTPTGTVQFQDTVNGTLKNLGSPVALQNGTATFSTSTLAFGAHTISAQYGGDGNYAATNSGPLTQTVDNPAPGNLALNPTAKFAGESGFTLTITSSGGGFIGSANTPFAGTVAFGGRNLSSVTLIDNRTLQASVTSDLITNPGTINVTVTNPQQKPSLSPASAAFEVKSSASATVNAINPNGIAVGSNTFLMTITGKNFQKGATINWNFTPIGSRTSIVTSLTPANPNDAGFATLIRVNIPGHDQGGNSLLETAGAAIVSVVNPDGSISNGQPFTVGSNNPAPILTGITPSSAIAGGKSLTLHVTGTDFVPGAQINFGGTNPSQILSTTFDPADPNNTTLIATVPAGLIATAGTLGVTVSNTNSAQSNSQPFTVYNPQPTISSLTPGFLNIPGTVLLNGTTIPPSSQPLTINGASFAPGVSVLFNGTNVAITSASATSLQVSLDPALLTTAGLAQVTVVNPQTQASAASAPTMSIPINPVKALPNYPAPSNAAKNLRMFSVPYDYTGISPYDVLKGVTLSPAIDPAKGYDPQTNILTGITAFPSQAPLALYEWDPVHLGYLAASAPPTIDLQLVLGQGYWAVGDGRSNPFGLMRLGTPAGVTQFPISLQAGWNMIGNPFPKDVPLSTLQVLVNGTVIGFYLNSNGTNTGTGVSEGFVSPVFWLWDGSQYQDIYNGKTGDSTKDALKSYEGYWLYCYSKCSLLVTNQQSINR